jgi:hypothetical protein
LQKRRRGAALHIERDVGSDVVSAAWVAVRVARQGHWFNIPFDGARESNSLHSKRMKESSIHAQKNASVRR